MQSQKTTETKPSNADAKERQHMDEALNAQDDSTNLDAVREAARLGTIDTFMVDADLEDEDQRQDTDQPDGRPSPMANADNQEK
ncbi:hypothetical protein [Neorhizobium alkalisoli]|uniref:Uncharacterized protein n=1 Tax=Neorhizobium alkalisoli TaxID=528178 RepID=A0A561QX49_9HYPH|nr:hypothetical protein [Neorhizobium alkalisoli]TWF54954.1 hypothetical protein FHW37_103825 [Neorhizobium alkalisoli]